MADMACSDQIGGGISKGLQGAVCSDVNWGAFRSDQFHPNVRQDPSEVAPVVVPIVTHNVLERGAKLARLPDRRGGHGDFLACNPSYLLSRPRIFDAGGICAKCIEHDVPGLREFTDQNKRSAGAECDTNRYLIAQFSICRGIGKHREGFLDDPRVIFWTDPADG